MSHWNVQSPYETNNSGRLELGRRQELNNSQPLHTSGENSRILIDGPNLLMPPMMYPPASSLDGLVPRDNHYATSLLNLLHSERNELNPVMLGTSKQEFMPGWVSRHQGFGDQMPPDHGLDSGKEQ